MLIFIWFDAEVAENFLKVVSNKCVLITFQVIAGALLVVDHSIDITTDKGMKKCKIINSVSQIIMLLIIVLNILVVGLGGPQPNVPVLGSPNCFNSTETEP